MKKNIYILIIVVFIIAAGLLSYKIFFVKNKLEVEIGLNIANGMMSQIKDGNILVKIDNKSPLDNTTIKFVDKVFKVDSDCKYLRTISTQKDEQQFQLEQTEFIEKLSSRLKENNAYPEAPDRHEIVEIKPDQIIKGEAVKVYYYEINNQQIAKKIIVKLNENVSLDSLMYKKNGLVLTGKITKIDNQMLSLDASDIDFLTSTTSLGIKLIQIKKETEIIKKAKKSDAQFKQEQDIFNEQIRKDTGVNLKAPDWYVLTNIGMADLKIGDKITVYSNGNVESSEVTAQKIEYTVTE